jgi:signal transduction histidine kinase
MAIASGASYHGSLPLRATEQAPPVKLSTFIRTHIETILVEWESFARTLQPKEGKMSPLALRDHAKLILLAIADGIEVKETPDEQYDKSRGEGPEGSGPESAAATHGTLRHTSGFTLIQLTAEYRALRATVLRLWLPKLSAVNEEMAGDMMRFNEAIDQALAESVLTYSNKSAKTRDTFLAILGHDLRTPLATMSMAAAYLARLTPGELKIDQTAARIQRSVDTMSSMVNDLLDYARTQLDGEMPVAPVMADIGATCRAALDDAQAAHPDRQFRWSGSGELTISFDQHRMQQVLSNLLNNAARYGTNDGPVTMDASGTAEQVVIAVNNRGDVIPAEALAAIFAPMVRLSVEASADGPPSRSIGLGLYIAQDIVEAHGGTLGVTSSAADGTTFTIRLPRAAA